MFHPVPLYIGLRYVVSRSRGFFVSFISWISMLGICVGVAALITIISVMNGLEGELRTRLLSLAAHATLSAPPAEMREGESVAGDGVCLTVAGLGRERFLAVRRRPEPV